VDESDLAASLASLEAPLGACVEERRLARPDVAGFVFLFARVGAGGVVQGTAVYGTVGDPPLFACAERAFAAWLPPSGDAFEVELPVTVRAAVAARRRDGPKPAE
jgi:hypothetical protein